MGPALWCEGGLTSFNECFLVAHCWTHPGAARPDQAASTTTHTNLTGWILLFLSLMIFTVVELILGSPHDPIARGTPHLHLMESLFGEGGKKKKGQFLFFFSWY